MNNSNVRSRSAASPIDNWPSDGRSIIVKVQLPLYSTMKPQALVYDKDKKYQILVPITPQLLITVKGEVKSYFYAYLVADKKAGPHKYKIRLHQMVGEQSW